MIWAIRQLFSPMKYLSIRHGDDLFHSKRVYDYVLPLTLTLGTCATFYYLKLEFSILDKADSVKRILDLLALMIVFYLAALAAVATFDRKGIDTLLRGGDALLAVRSHDGGKYIDIKLTYRQFISYLFGYLSFLSLCLYVTIIGVSIVWPKLKQLIETNSLVIWSDRIIFFVVIFFLWQLIFTSLLGIYFLTERIQTLGQPDP